MSLLREAAAVLAQDNSPSDSTPTIPSSSLNTTSTYVTPNTGPSSTSTSSTTSNSSTSEVLRIFALFLRPTRALLGEVRFDLHKLPPKKTCRRQGNTRPKETWTLEVFCLVNVDESSTQREQEKRHFNPLAWVEAKFSLTITPTQFRLNKNWKVFSKLYGGFDLLRRGASGNGLVVIRPPASGYSAKYLRDSSGVGQSLLYIRPLLMSIDISTENTDGTDFDLEVRWGFLTL